MEELEEKVQSAQLPQIRNSEVNRLAAPIFAPVVPYTLLQVLAPQTMVLGPESS